MRLEGMAAQGRVADADVSRPCWPPLGQILFDVCSVLGQGRG